jgi:hypothetical protein
VAAVGEPIKQGSGHLGITKDHQIRLDQRLSDLCSFALNLFLFSALTSSIVKKKRTRLR